MARTCSHNSFHNSQYFLARRTAKTSMTTKAISYPRVALCKNKPRGQQQLVKLTIFMKLVLLAEPFHSFTLKERLDRNGILGIFNERICLSRQNTTARIYCCKSPMKSLGGIFKRKQCLHIARRTRRKFQLHFEPPC